MRMRIIIAVVVYLPAIRHSRRRCLAQAAFGGTIRDESGAMIADAKVSLTEESKGLFRESRSDRGGSFLFPAIIAGVYSVRVEKQGFSPKQINGLKIEIGQQASMAITLTA